MQFISKYMSIKLCASNYAMYDGFSMELMAYLKHQQHIMTKP